MALFQTALIYHTKNEKFEKISYYLEANVQDLYVTLKHADRRFTVLDMIRLGMGVKIRI